ncbi:MAG: PAS domain S-box protein [Bacteroidetes bacterium]|nr:PAS domain S-box protein [Bacteroidota bacterium]
MYGEIKKEHIHEIITSNLPVGFFVVNKEGEIVDFNSAAERITGYSKTKVLGKSHFQILHGNQDSQSCSLMKRTLQKHEEIVETETDIKKKNGEQIIISVTAFHLVDDKGDFLGGVELFRDITAQRKMERERKNMLSMFAHDMKNSAIISTGLISRLLALKVGKITDKQKDYLEIVHDNLSKIDGLITNFLVFSRLESKEYIPKFESYNIVSAIQKITETISLEARKNHIQIFFTCPDECFPNIPADSTMMDRAIINLLSNAIKYSKPDGTIHVEFFEQAHHILVHVKDTGAGIAKDNLPYIFDAFFRESDDSNGSGLGLAISKIIIEAHRGKVSVESSLGEGSTFSISLPKQHDRQ